MGKSKIRNVEFSLASRTLLVTVKDDSGRFVDSKFFESDTVIHEAKANIYHGENYDESSNQQTPN